METVTALLWATATMASLRLAALLCEDALALLSRTPRAWELWLEGQQRRREWLERHHDWYGTNPRRTAPYLEGGR